MLLLILGLPRSGTTAAYIYTCLLLGKRTGGKLLRLYEPFNYRSSICVRHDVLGSIPDDLGRLKPLEALLVAWNSAWVVEWMCTEKPRTPFLGWYRGEVCRLFVKYSMNNIVVVKDVYMWVKLPELYRVLKGVDLHVVFLARNIDFVYRDLLKWFNQARKIHLTVMRKYVLKNVTKRRRGGNVNGSPTSAGVLDRVRNVLKIIRYSRYCRLVSNMVSIGILYRGLNTVHGVGDMWRFGDEDLLLEMLREVYMVFIDVAWRMVDTFGSDRVHVVEFEDKLEPALLVRLLKNLLYK